ncbi:globin domain-containing protein [Actinomadura fibrosa]|uniref:nitric oxide dioxygenase n=1 Tax=Actinomadura fibrosa TaxID=111802 RepID=A0ABW2XUK8_9ACTN|nr:globin domain-containing protein [Actinomadura fibrosa]
MPTDPRKLKETFSRLERHSGEAAEYFYGRLFAEDPRLRALFPPAMGAQRGRLLHALTRIVWSQDSPADLDAYLARLGRDHRKYGVRPEHYPAVGTALLATLRAFAAGSWSPEAEAAWAAAYRRAADVMIEAAERDAAALPPWWVAEVAAHERRAGDLAVLTLRPGRPLPFSAGQYVTVQTARWPRVWRPYSIANAPRRDGTLRLHVRAVPAGWVSGALVRHTRPGDTVLLGPAQGAMTLDPESERDLLLIGGGTGLAPVKALAEQAVRSETRREVRLLVGARTEADLYDLHDLTMLAAAHPALTVVPVLSETQPPRSRPAGSAFADVSPEDVPSAEAMRGDLPDVLDRFDGWDEHDVYVAGPTEMIRRTVTVLQALGVPLTRVHHDLLKAEDVPAPDGGS